MLYIGYGVVMLGLGITRILFILAVYDPKNYNFLTTLGYVSSLAGVIFWLFILENYLVPKTKKIFTIISLFAFSFSIIALFGVIPREIALNVQYILLPFAMAVIVFIYIFLILKTTGDIRKKAIWVLIGLALIAIGQILDGEAIYRAVPNFPLIIPPVLLIMGILIFLISQLKE